MSTLLTPLTPRLLRRRSRRPPIVVADLTENELDVLEALDAAIQYWGNPSQANIAEFCHPPKSVALIHQRLYRLADRGWVQMTPGRHRGVRLLRPVPKRPLGAKE